MKLPFKTVLEMSNGLAELNGRNRVIESEGKPADKVFEPFAFPTQTRVNIVRNIQILRPLQEAYQEARKGLVAELSPDGTGHAIDSDPKLASRFTKRHDELLETKQPVKGLLFIPWSALDTAKVPAVTTARLGILVNDLPKPDDADLLPDDEVTQEKA